MVNYVTALVFVIRLLAGGGGRPATADDRQPCPRRRRWRSSGSIA